MQPMSEGINLDPQVLIAVQNERLAAGAIREAQLTAAVQQLTMQVMGLEQQVTELTPVEHEGSPMSVVEEKDASPNS